MRRLWSGMVLQLLAALAAVGVGLALTSDPRATPAVLGWVWAGAGIAMTPLALSVLRVLHPAVVDLAAGTLVGLASVGCYRIGGLALLIPAGLLGGSGIVHWVGLGERSLGKERGRPHLVGGTVLVGLGGFLGLSLTPLALLGWAMLLVAFVLLGIGLSRRRHYGGHVAD